MSRQLLLILFAVVGLPCSGTFAADRTTPTDDPSDAAFATIEYIRGYTRWQAFDDAPWRRMKEGTIIPLQGRVAIGMSAAFVIKIGTTKTNYTTAGIYELATGEQSSYVPRDTDPPGIKSMPKPKPKVSDPYDAKNKPLLAEVTITFVKNHVQWRKSDSDTWKKATVGTKLPIDAQIRVGLRSIAKLRLGEKTFTIDRLGVRSVKSLLTDNLPKFADTFGPTVYKVEGSELIEATIHAPRQTLSGWGMVAVARNVPLSEVVYPPVGPFNRRQTRQLIIENWPGQIDWVFECRRFSANEMKRLNRLRNELPTAEEHESTIRAPAETLIVR